MTLKRPTDPIHGEKVSIQQIEKNRKILENLVSLFPKEKLLELVKKGYVWHEALILENEKIVSESVARNIIRLWIGILLEAQKNPTNNSNEMRLEKNLIPPKKAFANSNFLKNIFKWNVLANFGLQEKQVIKFLLSFTNKISSEVKKTEMIQLPKNLWIKKDIEGFYLTTQ